MTTRKANPEVDAFIASAKNWREELHELRSILLGAELCEELKWGEPCYTLDGKNIVILNSLKGFCTLSFFKGALLKDPHGVLGRPGQHQSIRWFQFTSVREIAERRGIAEVYIREAIEVEKAGLKIKRETELAVPEELQAALDESADFKAAFEALTPGRQRAYIYHFSAPKLAKTRETRVRAAYPQILNGKGLLDD
jgi:uncharacterized protein YdeI (YjbR/CyaY-like superfamily)